MISAGKHATDDDRCFSRQNEPQHEGSFTKAEEPDDQVCKNAAQYEDVTDEIRGE